tara:strand:- start:969 stop:1292 length:324 start_codon:yes stop_codon:yes gene_type:complete
MLKFGGKLCYISYYLIVVVKGVTKMGGSKTRDGIRISRVTDAATGIEDVTLRTGRNHNYVLNYDGMRPCPVDTSTDARKMVVPWLRQVTDNAYTSRELYDGLRKGEL